VVVARTKKDGPGLRLRRRHVLEGTLAAAVAASCSSEETVLPGATTVGSGGMGGGGMGGSGGGDGGGGMGGQGGQGGAGPTSCDDPGGLAPEELLEPIDTVVVLMMENRSFDHYLGGSLGIVEGREDIDGLTGTESNPAPGGGDVSVFHMMNMTPEDPPHGWDAVHQQWNMGQHDGFVAAHAGSSQDEVMGYYVRDQVPIHHALADAYAVCNRWHAAVLGPTWPNRYYLHGATSNGAQSNVPVGGFMPLWGPMKNAGLSVKNYHHGIAWCQGAYFKFDDLASFDAFKADAAAGQLPNFSIIDPAYFGGGANDDHPTNGNVPLAQLLISDVHDTLAQSPQWNRCLLLVIYDEHGGFYDHVAPPPSGDADPEFDPLGIRIPGFAVGPFVRRGCAIDTVFEHSSVYATAMARWGLPAIGRAANAVPVSSCIDPQLVRFRSPQPAATLPRLDVSIRALRASFDRLRRGAVEPQHPEIADSLRQQGAWRRLTRSFDPAAVLERHLDDCVRRGLARLVP
jgi:phospholipase C